MPISEVELAAVAAPTGQCYVCFEDGAPPSECACTDRYIHVACLLKMSDTSGKTTCGVCLQQHVSVELRSTTSISRRGKVVVAMLMTWPWVMCLATWRAEDWLSDPHQGTGNLHAGRAVETVVELLVTVLLFLCVLMECFLYRKGKWRFLAQRARAVVSSA